MAVPGSNVVVQNTVDPFAIAITSSGTPDLSTASAPFLHVSRQLPPATPGGVPPPRTLETWTCTIDAGATPTALSLTVPLLGRTPGVQAVTNPSEAITIRPYLTIAGQPLEMQSPVGNKQPISLLVTPETT